MKNNANDGKNVSDEKHPSHGSDFSHPLLPPRGDYQTLLSFQKAEVVYDLTFRFAHKFLAKGDRTVDQMIQSARSGKKNILEGSKAALTSKETEIKLTNVALAFLVFIIWVYIVAHDPEEPWFTPAFVRRTLGPKPIVKDGAEEAQPRAAGRTQGAPQDQEDAR